MAAPDRANHRSGRRRDQRDLAIASRKSEPERAACLYSGEADDLCISDEFLGILYGELHLELSSRDNDSMRWQLTPPLH